MKGRNLRNQVPIYKAAYPFLKTVHSSPLKNTALRLKDAYDGFFQHGRGFPNHRSWKKKWFSLYYDEPKKGFKLLNPTTLRLSFGKNEENKQIMHVVQLHEPLHLNNEIVKTLRVTKNHQRYYAIFTVERQSPTLNEQKTWIAFDPNHKNLMIGIDHEGKTFEFKNLPQLKYWDQVIDQLKSKRDQCQKKSRYIKTEHSGYWKPSRSWERFNQALEKAYHTRREQVKQTLYAIVHWTAKRYDEVLIGDYVPTLNVAKYQTMHRAMLNQTPVGKLRHTLEWVQQKSGKHYKIVDESNTTKACSDCGHLEKKTPNIRIFTCDHCGNTFNRDINSSVNIAKKGNKTLPGSGYIGLEDPMYTVAWCFQQSKIKQQLTSQMNQNKIVKI